MCSHMSPSWPQKHNELGNKALSYVDGEDEESRVKRENVSLRSSSSSTVMTPK